MFNKLVDMILGRNSGVDEVAKDVSAAPNTVMRDTFTDNNQVTVINNTYHYGSVGHGESLGYNTKFQFELDKIEKLIEEDDYKQAIDECINLSVKPNIHLESNDKIEISIYLMNCYLNIPDKDKTKQQLDNIKENEHLLNSPSAWKFYFYSAVHYFNSDELEKSALNNNKALELNPDNVKLKVFDVLCNEDKYSFDDVMKTYFNDDMTIIDSIEDKYHKYVIVTLCQYAIRNSRYEEAKNMIEKSGHTSQVLRYNLAISYHMTALSTPDGRMVNRNKIHYPTLNKAIQLYNDLLEEEISIRELKLSIVNNYLTCLYLMDDIETFKEKYSSYKSDDEVDGEVTKIFHFIQFTQSGELLEQTEDMTPSESQWVIAVDFHMKKEYEKVINMLPNEVLSIYDEDRFYAIKLDSLLGEDRIEEFDSLYDMAIGKYPDSDILKISMMRKIIRSESIDAAVDFAECIEKWSEKATVLTSLIEASINKKLYDKACQFFNMTLLSDNSPPLFKNAMYINLLDKLARDSEFGKAFEVIEMSKDLLLQNDDVYKSTSAIYYYGEDFGKAIPLLDMLYEKTNNDEFLYKSMVSSFKMNRLSQVIEKANKLIEINPEQKSHYLMVLSNAELLLDNEEQSFEYVEEAVELDKDKPTSEVHSLYVNRALRFDKRDKAGYIYEFAEKYPKHNDWLQAIKAIETQEDGEDKPTDEIIEFFKQSKERYFNLLNLYKQRSINYTGLCKNYSRTFIEMLPWRAMDGFKVWMNNGNELKVENYEILNKGILIDSGSLFMLDELGILLKVLENYKLYVNQATIEELQTTLIRVEYPKVRELLDLIESNGNITVIRNMHYELRQFDIEDNLNALFNADQVSSMGTLLKTDYIYLYSDMFQQPVIEGLIGSERSISIMNLVVLLSRADIYTVNEYVDLIIKMKRSNYEFVVFNDSILYIILENNNFIINDDLRLFFELNRNYNLLSFAKVYVGLLSKLYAEERYECFDAILIELLKIASEYDNKKKYYLQRLIIEFPNHIRELLGLYNTSNLDNIAKNVVKIEFNEAVLIGMLKRLNLEAVYSNVGIGLLDTFEYARYIMDPNVKTQIS